MISNPFQPKIPGIDKQQWHSFNCIPQRNLAGRNSSQVMGTFIHLLRRKPLLPLWVNLDPQLIDHVGSSVLGREKETACTGAVNPILRWPDLLTVPPVPPFLSC